MDPGLQTVLLALIAAGVTLGAPIIAFYLASVKRNQEAVVNVTAEVAANQTKVLEQGELIHKTVNSGQTAMLEEQKKLQEKILELTMQNATMVETIRTSDIQTAKVEAATAVTKIEEAKAAGIAEGKQIAATPTPPVDVAAPSPLPVEIVATVPVPVETETGRSLKPPG